MTINLQLHPHIWK